MTLAKLVKIVVAALEEIKAHDIEALDVTRITTLFDRMIIASGDSNRHTRAIANNVVEKVKTGGGTVYGMEGEQTGEWVLVDLGDVLVHIMQTTVRAHYNLEELWAEAKKKKISKAKAGAGESKVLLEPLVVKSSTAKPSTAKPRKASAKLASPIRKKSPKPSDAS
ncbi:ribosome-associated protein [Nitrosospira sp. Nsp5]|uniref:Ribosomal silencing factor RsfS n=1 Tax=Nitrosospira multiformis TaxID=1231 RepID=A0ABY0T8C1_9PROT|nr:MULTISPECIES: ribosome silencing factor [Nitrosospira]PTR07364.1 ribosome-associated protein [Nitrosospira sp. Nsp5]SDQ42970.1 ribosome-associated protein [Nitrosospira multiformis]